MEPIVILCESAFSGNVGAVARAMANMGLSNLRLVSPICNPYDDEAVARAVHAKDILIKAPSFSSLGEALFDIEDAYGFSVRERHSFSREISARDCALECVQSDAQMAWVFGNEQSGLSNEQLSYCRTRVFIPTKEEYASMNLSQAVQVASYLFFESKNEMPNSHKVPNFGRQKKSLAGLVSSHRVAEKMDELMQKVHFYDGRESKRHRGLEKLKRIYVGAQMSSGEVDLLLGFCRLLEQRLDEAKNNKIP